MSIVQQINTMVEQLPSSEQVFILEFVRKISNSTRVENAQDNHDEKNDIIADSFIDEKLAEAEERIKSGNAKWLDHDEFWDKVRAL